MTMSLEERNAALREVYLKDVIETGHQYQLHLSTSLQDQGFEVESVPANDARFPDIRASKDDLDLFIEAKSSKNAPVTSLRALSYYPPSKRWPKGRFLINKNSVGKYGSEGAQLLKFINGHDQILQQASELYSRIEQHFGNSFDVIGKDTFSNFGDKATRQSQFRGKADEYKKQYSTASNDNHMVASIKNDPNSRKQAVVMTMPIGKLVNRIFSHKFQQAVDGENPNAMPIMLIGGKGDQMIDQLKWFEFALPSEEQKQAIRAAIEAVNTTPVEEPAIAGVDEPELEMAERAPALKDTFRDAPSTTFRERIITSASPGRLELIMKIRFDETKQLFDVGVLLYLD